ncbi:MAG: hypothetical protein AAGG48_31180 [Planctomycetota bacterium]
MANMRFIETDDLNPFEPPPADRLVPLLWDRMVFVQIGLGVHLLLLIVYASITIDSDQPPLSMLAEIDPSFNIAMAVCSAIAFLLVFALAITKRAWPLYQRLSIIGIDLILLGAITYSSHGFGFVGSS